MLTYPDIAEMCPPSFRIAVFLGTLLCPKLGRIYNGIETFSEKTLQSEKPAPKKEQIDSYFANISQNSSQKC